MKIQLDLPQGEHRQLKFDDRHRLRLADSAAGEFISAAVKLANPAPVRVSWLAQWTAPQHWEKFAGNPIYTPALTGWNNWVNGVSIIPLPDGQTYRMYYAGHKGQGIGFAEAAVSEPTQWKDHGGPVLKPRGDNWEGDFINQPRVVKVTDTHWRMYYTGWGFQGAGSPWATGLAESFDGGRTWKRYQDDPIIERGPLGSADDGAAMVPSLLRVGDRWLMWYTSVKVTTNNAQHIHLCLAESPDGIHWTKYEKNPVLTDPLAHEVPRSVISRPYVRHDDGVFRLWYSYGRPGYRIYYAESLDGCEWELSPVAPVLGPSPKPAWDDDIVEYPEVQIVNGEYRLWFCGNGFGSVGYATGKPETSVTLFVRTSAGADWREITRDNQITPTSYLQIKAVLRSSNPKLSPALNSITIE
ncbi:MAG: hypothetical protein PCFJNLEI_00604 [Verrucomicrobiae bacterium]|nr:hypothetical protein [Verrucomicrobiae bacterium]